MSGLRRALAATTMAVAAAGGGLLIAAAGAVPAYASAPAAPPGAHTITITAHVRANAAGRIGPRTILPCAVKPGVTPASCGDETVSCSLTVATPFFSSAAGAVYATANVDCTDEVASIRLTESLLKNGASVNTDTDTPQGLDHAATLVGVACQAGTYANTATASITPASGYVLAGSNPEHDTSASVQFTTSVCHGGTTGGGSGCAMHAPSLAGHQAGRHPDLISCG